MRTLALFLLLLSTLYSDSRIILTTHNLPPYGSYQLDGRFDGIAVKPVRYALEEMGLLYEIRVVPWQRAQAMVINGLADGFFAASKNQKRDAYAVMSEVIAAQKWNWYWLKEKNFDIQSQSFKTRTKVSSFNGANMQKWLKQKGYNIAAQPQDTDHAITLLLANRFEALLANNYVMEDLIQKRELQDKFIMVTEKNKPLGVYFSKEFLNKNPSFLETFNKHIREYKKKHMVYP